MKAIILARVSSKEQEENNSIPAQTRRLLEYTERRGLQVIETYQLVESSTKSNRKCFSEIIGRIAKSKDTIALVTDTVDRLQRSFRESVRLDELRKANKVELHFIRENLIINSKSNSADIMRWDMGVIFAKSYVAQLSDNVKRSLEEKLKNGELSTHAPFGYRNCRKDGKAFVEPDSHAPIVCEMFHRYATGAYSLRSMRDFVFENYAIKKPVSTIAHILKNPFYCGFILHEGKLYSHKYETLIDKDLFDKVQLVLGRMHKMPHKYCGIPFTYRGLVICNECGCRITVEKQKGHTYYHCTQHKGRHNAKYVREEVLDAQIMQALSDIHPTDEQYAVLIEVMQKECISNGEKQKTILAHLSSERSKNKQRIERLFDLYLDGGIGKEEYQAERQKLKAEEVALNQRIEKIDTNAGEWFSDIKVIMDLVKNAPLLFEKSSKIHLKRQLIKIVFSNLELSNNQLRYEYNKPFNLMTFRDNCPMWSG